MLAVVIALLPVLAFLLALVLADSFKLVPRAMLVRALLAGAAAAFAAMPLHAWLLAGSGLGPVAFSRYVAPLTEETLKAACVLYPLRRREVGFLVDAAIIGVGIGTGFAVVENVEYLQALADRHLVLWVARGFGAAFLHATTTAIVAIVAKSLADRHPERGLLAVLPGWGAAVLLHSAFNHALVSPVLASAVLVLALPLALVVVFERSERATRTWVGDGLDIDVELLRLVLSTEFGATRLGQYLRELRSRFDGMVVADIFCLLRLDLELAIRAKGMLMAREAGLEVPVDADLRERLKERAYLQRAIGPTGLLALRPLQGGSSRDEWLLYLLKATGAGRRGWAFWRPA